MMKYIKRPEYIEAVFYDGDNLAEVQEFMGGEDRALPGPGKAVTIFICGQQMFVDPKYFIVRHKADVVSLWRPDDFTTVYEVVPNGG